MKLPFFAQFPKVRCQPNVAGSLSHRHGTISSPYSVRNAQPAFSLVEILVTIALLSVIVLGLMAMFNQTQRAFRSSMTQTDVLENGRAAMDLLMRELEQVTPANLQTTINFYAWYIPRKPDPPAPLLQELISPNSPPDPPQMRTNVLQEFFFLTRNNRDWSAVGYTIGVPHPDPNTGMLVLGPPNFGVGTLYRFVTNVHESERELTAHFYQVFQNAPLTNLHRVADGVVHLRVRAFDTKGMLIDTNSVVRNAIIQRDILPSEVQYWFYSNAVPAYVEIELGMLETHLLGRFLAMTNNPDTARKFLEKQSGGAHLFRQRVPIRNVDPTVYQ